MELLIGLAAMILAGIVIVKLFAALVRGLTR